MFYPVGDLRDFVPHKLKRFIQLYVWLILAFLSIIMHPFEVSDIQRTVIIVGLSKAGAVYVRVVS